MRATLDVYEESKKPSFRIRLPADFSLRNLDLSGSWVVVPTEDGGEVAISLTVATRLVVRERTERDESDYGEKAT